MRRFQSPNHFLFFVGKRAWFEFWRASEFNRQNAEAAKAYRKAVDTNAMVGLGTLGSDEAADALQRLRCKFTLKDKDGKAVGSICHTGY